MTKQVRKPKSDKVKADYYRSPIDKLVDESGLAGTVIAEKMGIKYHRMVALRRMKGVDIADIELCEKAIAELKESEPKAQTVFQVEKVKATRKSRKTKVKQSNQPNDTQLAYLLGQAMVFVGIFKDLVVAEEGDKLAAFINLFENDVKHYLK